jgi:hypothetical protein
MRFEILGVQKTTALPIIKFLTVSIVPASVPNLKATPVPSRSFVDFITPSQLPIYIQLLPVLSVVETACSYEIKMDLSRLPDVKIVIKRKEVALKAC